MAFASAKRCDITVHEEDKLIHFVIIERFAADEDFYANMRPTVAYGS